MNLKQISIKVKRMDINVPEQILRLELDPFMSYEDLKHKIQNVLNITDEKVFKVRNNDGSLVPLTDILESNSTEPLYTLDVTNVHHNVPAVECTSPLQSVYQEALKRKIYNMESRIMRIESFLPQLKNRRESLLERTTHALESRISFLDRRIDELTPPQWLEYMKTMDKNQVPIALINPNSSH